MPRAKIANSLSLAGYDELFTCTEDTSDVQATDGNQGERIIELPLSELHPPEFHPFYVNDDDAMDRLAENIGRYGVREPGQTVSKVHIRLRTVIESLQKSARIC